MPISHEYIIIIHDNLSSDLHKLGRQTLGVANFQSVWQ